MKKTRRLVRGSRVAFSDVYFKCGGNYDRLRWRGTLIGWENAWGNRMYRVLWDNDLVTSSLRIYLEKMS
jgi:hypothetical protein